VVVQSGLRAGAGQAGDPSLRLKSGYAQDDADRRSARCFFKLIHYPFLDCWLSVCVGPTRFSLYGILRAMPVLKNIAAIAKGMSITFMEMFQPTTVENYPDGKGPLRGARIEARFRGAHVLQRDENGLEKCVACFLCAANCPSNCIYIEAADNTAEHRVSGAERYAKTYNIDYNRCIFCGYCVEACPTDAITHGHGFELATFNASNLVYRKEQMLAPRPAHMGDNVIFNQADVDGGAPKEMVAGS